MHAKDSRKELLLNRINYYNEDGYGCGLVLSNAFRVLAQSSFPCEEKSSTDSAIGISRKLAATLNFSAAIPISHDAAANPGVPPQERRINSAVGSTLSRSAASDWMLGRRQAMPTPGQNKRRKSISTASAKGMTEPTSIANKGEPSKRFGKRCWPTHTLAAIRPKIIPRTNNAAPARDRAAPKVG